MIALIKPFITFKNILVVLFIAVVGFAIWHITDTYNDVNRLESEIQKRDYVISNIEKNLKSKDAIIEEVKKRVRLLEIMESDRKNRVIEQKEKSKTFSQETKTKSEEIRNNSPDNLDEFYSTRYNIILECLEDVSKNKDSIC